MTIRRFELSQEIDETGSPDEFSWDLIPLVSATLTTHLDSSGLPKVGTMLRPGMILVGKIGKSRTFDPTVAPSCLEVHGVGEAEVRRRYGHMWLDRSLYVDDTSMGIVRSAALVERGGRLVATVEVELMPTAS